MGATTAETDTLNVEVAQGADADALLSEAAFQRAWVDLAVTCPWATACQSLAFAEVWLSVYRELYEPLLVFKRSRSGQLIGLLPLAIERASGAIVHVGAHQAEYQVWLASEANSDLFIEQALDALLRYYPGRRLQLKYVPPGLPLGWRTQGRRWRWMSIVREHRRPLLATGTNSSAERSLRAKANRKRISQLERDGALTFVHMQARPELERVMDVLVDFYDLRQGAVSSSMPFRDDPRKREFTLRMLEKPGLTHVSVLMQGDMPVAANIGLVNGSYVSLGVIAHSPFHAKISPGKIHILLLARQLGEQGFRDLDLTAGGGKYKDRLADHADHVYLLSIHFHWATHVWETSRSTFRAILRKALGGEGSTLPARLRSLASASPGSLIGSITRKIVGRSRGSQRQYYEVDPEIAKQIAAENILRVNCISDLLLYRPLKGSDQTRGEFLRFASRRLEVGDRVYTLSKNGALLHCAWLTYPAGASGVEFVNSAEYPRSACLLWDSYTHPQEDGWKLRKLSLAQSLCDAARVPGVEKILIAARPDESPLLRETGAGPFQFKGIRAS